MKAVFFFLTMLPLSLLADSFIFPADGIEVQILETGDVESFRLQAGVNLEAQQFELENPTRIAFELPQLKLSKNYEFHRTGSSLDYKVRLGKHRGKSRIVLDFGKNALPKNTLRSLRDGFQIEFAIPNPALLSKGIEDELDLRSNPDLDFQLSQEVVYLNASNAHKIEIRNVSQHNLELTAKLQMVRYPGTKSEIREPCIDILLQPTQLFLHPGRIQKVSLLSLVQAPLYEKLYELQLAPVESSSYKKVELDVEGQKKSVTLGAGVRVPVFLTPREELQRLVWKQDDDVLLIENIGTVSALLSKGNFCKDPIAQKGCLQLPSFRVYPGNVVGLPISPKISGQIARTVQGRTDSIQIYR